MSLPLNLHVTPEDHQHEFHQVPKKRGPMDDLMQLQGFFIAAVMLLDTEALHHHQHLHRILYGVRFSVWDAAV